MSIFGVHRADVRFDGASLKLVAGPGAGAPGSLNGLVINTNGNVGIGTTTPFAKLNVNSSGDGIYAVCTGTGGTGVFGQSVGTSGAGIYGLAASSNGEGVHGESTGSGAAVNGTSSASGTGVYGTSASGYAGYFAGIVGVTGNVEANSVRGTSHNAYAAVYGENASPTGWAGYFAGNVYVGGTLSTPSDRNVKRDFASVDCRQVLERVARLAIQTWAYTNNAAIRHLGPVAQDFKAAFDLGSDDKSIATVDADGVALAAIQGLNEKLEEQRAENTELRARLEKLEQLIAKKSVGVN
jgi:hypothetical protein